MDPVVLLALNKVILDGVMEITLYRFDVLQTGATSQGSLKVCWENRLIRTLDHYCNCESATVCRSCLKGKIGSKRLQSVTLPE